jgi:eukaryotic-like serine/threonine-protein kinase
MEASRWKRLQMLFEQALSRPPEAREAFVQEACAADSELAKELRALLASDSAPDSVPGALARAASRVLHADSRGLVGQRLGAWRIESHLADGGMGAVYLAARADGQYEQPAALKLLNPGLISPAAQERMAQERQILARLTHPHIARLLDGGRTPEGLPYLVMEYVDGVPIDAWCHERGLDTAARLRLFVKVCAAVDHAHRNFIVHRDLKPSNILVDGDGVPKLLDFGIAKLLESHAEADLTRSGERLLTPSHASPEQITGGAISTATDVYALGVLLYDLLTGKRPHEATSGGAVALARAILDTEPTRPSDAVASTGTSRRRLRQLRERGEQLTPERLARELKGDLDNIVLMALRKEPERRYASAQALADDIERHLSNRPVRARPDTLAYRSGKFWRRHPVAVPASALALLLALAGSAAFAWRLSDERDRALAAEAQATQAADRARQAAEFTASILENTGANRGAAREVSVQDLLATASRRVRDELKDAPPVATGMRTALGRALHSWGSYDEALKELQPALAEARSRGAAGVRDEAEILSLLGTVTHDLGELETSLDWTRQAEARWQAVGTPAEKASALSDLAMALNGLRRRSEAEPVFRAALAQMRLAHPGDHEDTAWLLNNLGWCLHAMGRLDEAGPIYEEALTMQRRMGSALVDISQTLSNVAGLAYDRGEWGGAGVPPAATGPPPHVSGPRHSPTSNRSSAPAATRRWRAARTCWPWWRWIAATHRPRCG